MVYDFTMETSMEPMLLRCRICESNTDKLWVMQSWCVYIKYYYYYFAWGAVITGQARITYKKFDAP